MGHFKIMFHEIWILVSKKRREIKKSYIFKIKFECGIFEFLSELFISLFTDLICADFRLIKEGSQNIYVP
jgi:hypothetical protein